MKKKKSSLERISAYIPIKEHSSRIPNKNFKLMNDKPLFYWVINTLEGLNEIGEIVINTDSKLLITQMNDYKFTKIKFINRAVKLCGDDVSVNSIILNDLPYIKNEIILQTHVTNPLVKAATFTDSIKKFHNNRKNNDSLFSVNRYQKRFYNKDILPINHDPSRLIKTQDLDPLYVENSCIYIFTKESIKEAKARIGLNPLLYPMNEYESFDIDWPEDFKFVEGLLKTNQILR